MYNIGQGNVTALCICNKSVAITQGWLLAGMLGVVQSVFNVLGFIVICIDLSEGASWAWKAYVAQGNLGCLIASTLAQNSRHVGLNPTLGTISHLHHDCTVCHDLDPGYGLMCD